MPSTDTVTVDREVLVNTLVELFAYEEIVVRFNGGSETPLSNGLLDVIAKLFAGGFGEVTWDEDDDEVTGLYRALDARGDEIAREWYSERAAA